MGLVAFHRRFCASLVPRPNASQLQMNYITATLAYSGIVFIRSCDALGLGTKLVLCQVAVPQECKIVMCIVGVSIMATASRRQVQLS